MSSDPVAGGSALLFWSKVAGNAGFFVAVLMLARALGPTGRGTIAFITVTALVASHVAGLGVGEATTVFAARRPEARGALFANVVAFMTGSGAVAAAVACGVLVLLGDSAPAGLGGPELAALAGATVVSAAGTAGYFFLLGCHRIRQVALITATASWVYPALLLAIWATAGLTVLRAAVAWAAAEAVRALAYLARSARGLRLVRVDVRLLVESVRFGIRAWVGSMARFLNFRTDQILMGFLASEAALGVYAVAVNASEVLLLLPAATATALLPVAARTESGLRADQALRAFRSAALVTGGAALVGAALGPVLLPVVFGEPFEASVTPFLLLLPGALGFVAIAVFSNALVAGSAPGLSSVGPLVSLGVGIALDLVLIPRFGASGAAAAASAAFLAGGAAALLAFRRRSPFTWGLLVQPRRSDLTVFRALAAPLRAVR
ncbi:MAG TPA: oligosaccharide flippase family protein [Gaiellaceae bacterium]|nr:oligosaccharide flippase family protein [Gaiellaceae bacterium]